MHQTSAGLGVRVDPATMAFGGFCLAVGLGSAVMRQTHPHRLKKLTAMKQTWGEGAGWALHFVSYTVLPLVCGCVFLLRGSQGHRLF